MLRTLAFLIVFLSSLNTLFFAQTLKKWDGGHTTNNWSDAANWFPDGVPSTTDSVVLDHSLFIGDYTVDLPTTLVTIKSLSINPTSSDSIQLNFLSSNTTGKLILTATGYNALRIGNRGRFNNKHGGGANFFSVQIKDSSNYGMLLDIGGYYLHGTLTKDLPFLNQLDARTNSTFEYQRNINGTDNGFMIFPAPVAQYPSLSQVKFYHLILSGSVSPAFSPDYAVTPARNWNMYIDGNLTVRNNACFGFHRGGSGQDTRTIYLKGDIYVQNTSNSSWIGTLAPISLAWNVVFDGSAQQNIYGNVDFMDRTEINNPNGIYVENTLNISSNMFSFYTSTLPSIVFVQGKITTNSSTGLISVNVTPVNAIVGHSPSGYINGKLRRGILGTGSYAFPVGTATNYELATIGLNGISGPNTITAEFFTTGIGTIPTALIEGVNNYQNLLNAGFWRITPNTALTAGNYSVTLKERGYTNGVAPIFTIVKRIDASNPWTLQGIHVSSAEMAGEVTAQRNSFSSFSDFAIAIPPIIGLPVELNSFEVYPLNSNKVIIEWSTQSEDNNDYFNIERSQNGTDWRNVAIIPGKGFSNLLSKYEVVDDSPYLGTSYYRLNQTDLNGHIEELGQKSVNLKRDYPTIEVYPNPASDHIVIAGLEQEYVQIEILNLAGLVYQKKFFSEGSAFVTLDIQDLPAGIYIIRVNAELIKIVKL